MAKKRRKQTETAAAIFGCYGILMLYLLFIRGRHAVDGVPYWEQVLNNYNLTPFHTVGNYWHILTNREYYVEKWEAYSVYRYHARHAFINLAGNVAMFVPLGFLLLFPGFTLRRPLHVRLWYAAVVVPIILQLIAAHFVIHDPAIIGSFILLFPGTLFMLLGARLLLPLGKRIAQS